MPDPIERYVAFVLTRREDQQGSKLLVEWFKRHPKTLRCEEVGVADEITTTSAIQHDMYLFTLTHDWKVSEWERHFSRFEYQWCCAATFNEAVSMIYAAGQRSKQGLAALARNSILSEPEPEPNLWDYLDEV